MMLARGFSGLWEHSLGCAVTAGVIARKINVPNPEEVSIAALLHDIGKVVIKIELPNDYPQSVPKVWEISYKLNKNQKIKKIPNKRL